LALPRRIRRPVFTVLVATVPVFTVPVFTVPVFTVPVLIVPVFIVPVPIAPVFVCFNVPVSREGREEMSLKRAAEAERANRDTVRSLVLTALSCVGWCAVGLLFLMWSAHTTDVGYGRIAFFGGLVVGNGGILVTLIVAYARAERRGH
jgi:hypothetical protein